MDYTNEENILEWLKTNLNEERYFHVLGSADCAVELAKMFSIDENKARLTGLLHDCAKCFSNEKLLEIIEEHFKEDMVCTEFLNYKTLHAPVSAHLAQKQFGVKDKEILNAIRWHTLGRIDMSQFEKVIFVADKIEKNTRDLEFRNLILEILKEQNGLDKAMLICFEATIKSLVDRKLKICHQTVDVYNNLLDILGHK